MPTGAWRDEHGPGPDTRPAGVRPSEDGRGADDGAWARTTPSRPPTTHAAPHPAARPGPRGYHPSGWQTPDGRPVLRGPVRGGHGSGVARLFVGLGRSGGVRPGDLVGAITSEAGLVGRDIGAIQIADGFSLVEVPEAAADRVISALRGATLRGQRVVVRRERY